MAASSGSLSLDDLFGATAGAELAAVLGVEELMDTAAADAEVGEEEGVGVLVLPEGELAPLGPDFWAALFCLKERERKR